MKRAFVSVTAVALLLLAAQAASMPPTRVDFAFDETFPSGFLPSFCGIPVFIHVQGGGTTTLHYDNDGNLIRELDTLAEGATTTIFSPVELGGTGKSFTDETHAPSTFLYPDGTDIGDAAIVILNGVQRTSGPGNPRIVGRESYEGVIIDYTPDGVPVVDPIVLVSQHGQFDLVAVLQARCDALAAP
jgi:YD repeat-containing protein